MKVINIRLHEVTGVNAPQLNVHDLNETFGATGFQINFLPGSTLPSDPAEEPNFSYLKLIGPFKNEDATNGHLVIGGMHPSWNLAIAGELVDLDNRGVSVVYAGSNYVKDHGAVGLLQTTVHEIGHILNLSHIDVDSKYKSAMNQADDRTQTAASAWTAADIDAKAQQASGKETFWTNPQQAPACHPFCFTARSWLHSLSDDRLLPWGTKFERPYNGNEDVWHTDTSLWVEPEADNFRLGGVLAFTVVFENRTGRLIMAPFNFGPTFDTLMVQVRRPDGTVYRHRPRGLCCSTGVQVLAPGEIVRAPFSTVRGPGGFALNQVGQYEVVVIAPALGVGSLPVKFDVISPGSTRPLITRQLVHSASFHRLGSARQKRVTDLLGQTGIDPLTRGYLAMAKLSGERDGKEVAKLERLAMASSSPNEVRHAAAISRAKRLARAGELTASARRELCDRFLNNAGDERVATLIREEVR
ncbi:MAG TPA: hypothetical protein VJM34_17045 [Novosphingobium sp.]|nr:hypothetical protein [Novosphingobium sp.]